MDKKLPELSIFFPFWNEEENIKSVVTKAIPIAEKVAKKWEILMIDDGSSDKTKQIALKLEGMYPNVRLITHSPNRGYGAALKEGFKNAKYEYIVFNDGDDQFDFSEISRFIGEITNHDVVIGFRKKRKDEFRRHVLMYLLKIWDYVLFRFYFKDIDCGFKMFKREALDQIMPLRSEGAMITSEILAKAKIKKLSISQVEVTHYPRMKGQQSGAHAQVVIRAILESFILWWDIHNGRI